MKLGRWRYDPDDEAAVRLTQEGEVGLRFRNHPGQKLDDEDSQGIWQVRVEGALRATGNGTRSEADHNGRAAGFDLDDLDTDVAGARARGLDDSHLVDVPGVLPTHYWELVPLDGLTRIEGPARLPDPSELVVFEEE